MVGRFHPLAPLSGPSSSPPPLLIRRCRAKRGETRGSESGPNEREEGKGPTDLRSGLGSPRLRLRSGPGTSKAPPIFLFHPSKEPGEIPIPVCCPAVERRPRNSQALKRDASRFCRRCSIAGMSRKVRRTRFFIVPGIPESKRGFGCRIRKEVACRESSFSRSAPLLS